MRTIISSRYRIWFAAHVAVEFSPMRIAIITDILFVALLAVACTAGVRHGIAVILPTPHMTTPDGAVAREHGNLYFYTDRNIPDTSFAYGALVNGKTDEALAILSRIEGANLPDVQRAYWQTDVAACFILDGRYKEADELLVQAGLLADDEAIRHNHRVSVYLNESQKQAKAKKLAKPQIVPASKSDIENKSLMPTEKPIR